MFSMQYWIRVRHGTSNTVVPKLLMLGGHYVFCPTVDCPSAHIPHFMRATCNARCMHKMLNCYGGDLNTGLICYFNALSFPRISRLLKLLGRETCISMNWLGNLTSLCRSEYMHHGYRQLDKRRSDERCSAAGSTYL